MHIFANVFSTMDKKQSQPISIARHLKSQEFAWRGLVKIFDHEGNFKIEIIAAIFSIAISLLLKISSVEFAIVVFCIGLILALETVNGVVELLCDIITKEYRKDIEYAKDAMAGAVLIGALTTAVVGFIIWTPYIITLIGK